MPISPYTITRWGCEGEGYMGWYNHDRLHEALGDLPPAEYETLTANAAMRD